MAEDNSSESFFYYPNTELSGSKRDVEADANLGKVIRRFKNEDGHLMFVHVSHKGDICDICAAQTNLLREEVDHSGFTHHLSFRCGEHLIPKIDKNNEEE